MLEVLIPTIGVLAAITVAAWSTHHGNDHTLARWAAADCQARIDPEPTMAPKENHDVALLPNVVILPHRGHCAVPCCRTSCDSRYVICDVCTSLVSRRSKRLFEDLAKKSGISEALKVKLGIAVIQEAAEWIASHRKN